MIYWHCHARAELIFSGARDRLLYMASIQRNWPFSKFSSSAILMEMVHMRLPQANAALISTLIWFPTNIWPTVKFCARFSILKFMTSKLQNRIPLRHHRPDQNWMSMAQNVLSIYPSICLCMCSSRCFSITITVQSKRWKSTKWLI